MTFAFACLPSLVIKFTVCLPPPPDIVAQAQNGKASNAIINNFFITFLLERLISGASACLTGVAGTQQAAPFVKYSNEPPPADWLNSSVFSKECLYI
jgi:hypothetical protein